MVERYDYAYKVWHCRINGVICDRDGCCDQCDLAKDYAAEDLNPHESYPILEPTKTKEIEK